MRADDPRLGGLPGGYRLPFDPRPDLGTLAAQPEDGDAWDSLWENLHHQGDVGEASYAAVVLLANSAATWARRPWHLYALIAIIEVERHAVHNPDVPGWMEADYREALAEIKALALRDLGGAADRLLLRSALSVVAAAAGDHALATMLGGLDDSELAEFNEEQVAYSERYRLRH